MVSRGDRFSPVAVDAHKVGLTSTSFGFVSVGAVCTQSRVGAIFCIIFGFLTIVASSCVHPVINSAGDEANDKSIAGFSEYISKSGRHIHQGFMLGSIVLVRHSFVKGEMFADTVITGE